MSSEWYAKMGQQVVGPVSFEALTSQITAGALSKTDLVWRPGFAKWEKAAEIPGLFTPPADSKSSLPASAGPQAQPSRQIDHIEPQQGPDPFAREIPAEKKSRNEPAEASNYINRHWKGQLSLAHSYWVNGFLVNIIVGFVAALSGAYLQTNYSPKLSLAWLIIFPLSVLIIVVWQAVGIWRSANRHVSTTGRRGWAAAAQLAVVLGFFKTIVDLAQFIPIYAAIVSAHWGPDTFKLADVTVNKSGTEITIVGDFARGLSTKFSDYLDKNRNIRTVQLQSNGGWVDEGRAIGEQIAKRRLDVYVPVICQSACTLAFLAGKERWIGETGKLGFHQPSVKDLPASLQASLVSQEQDALVERGVPRDFAARAMATPPSDMWTPTNAELFAARLIDGVADQASYTASGQLRRINYSEKAFEAVQNIPVYKALKTKYPAVYNKIIAQIAAGIENHTDREKIASDIGSQIIPIVRAAMPMAADDVVLASASVHVEYMTRLLASDPETCAAFGDPSKSGPKRKTALTAFPDIAKQEIIVNARIIETSSQSYKPLKQEEVSQELALLARSLSRYGNLKMDLFDKNYLFPADYAPFCELNLAVYKEAMALPRPSNVRLLRYMFSSN